MGNTILVRKKKSGIAMILSIFFFVTCDIPIDPHAPENANCQLILKNSNSEIKKVYIEDTAGVEIGVGAVVRYPEFIDSIRINFVNESSEVVKTRKIVVDNAIDTIWDCSISDCQGKITVFSIAYIKKSIQYRDSATIQFLQSNKLDTVKFYLNDTLLKKTVVKHATTVTEIPVVDDTAKLFAGWYYTDADSLCVEFTKDTPVLSNMVVTAKWGCVDIDGNVYKTVKINNQIWTAENFKSKHYNDGNVIPFYSDSVSWITDTAGLMSYDEKSTSFGFLYNWYVVNSRKFTPHGWHVPTKAEFDTLISYLNQKYDSSADNNTVAKVLATNADLSWYDYKAIPGSPGYETGKNNHSGFNAIPQGLRKDSGQFRGYRQFAWYWCADTLLNVNYALITMIEYDSNYVFIRGRDKNYGCSVRLLKDK